MTKLKLKKRILSLLAIVAAAMMLPATVFAAGVPDKPSAPVTVRTEDGTEQNYDSLAAAFEDAPNGATVLLNSDIEMAYLNPGTPQQKRPTMVVENKTIILNGQGHTVTAENKAFNMIEVNSGGKLTVYNITLDGSAAENRRYSSIINIEGGEAVIEDGAVLKNNCTAAVDIGINKKGGMCTMNGGLITQNVIPAPQGSSDTGAAVTVLEQSTFIMNGGTISENRTEKYGSPGVMVNRGGTAILNGGIIENNSTSVNAMASALHIKGGYAKLNGTAIKNNTSANGYGAVYVTNHSSFNIKWDGVLDIDGGAITGNHDADGTANAIYLWSRSSIEDTGAYLYFSGSPEIEGASRIYANNSTSVAFDPLAVDGAFTPAAPVELNLLFDYVIGQTIVKYDNGLAADPSHFAAASEDYGFQKDSENNLLYTEKRRKLIFMDGEQELKGLSCWNFVEDTINEPDYKKPGFSLEGWYTDDGFKEAWDFDNDLLPREEGAFTLYSKWSVIPAQAPALQPPKTIELSCEDAGSYDLSADFERQEGYSYTYEWTDSEGTVMGKGEALSADLPANGESLAITLTVTAERNDNRQKASAGTTYIINRAQHDFDEKWQNDAAGHWRSCNVCGTAAGTTEHVFIWVTDKPATQTEPGSKHEECTDCGFKKAAVEIPAAGTDTVPPPDEPVDTEDAANGTDTSDTPVQSPSPNTGDRQNALPLAALLIGSLSAAVFTKRRKAK